MKTYIHFLLFLFFVLSVAKTTAQEDTQPVQAPSSGDAPPAKKAYYILSPRVSVTVPHPMGNKSFKKSFVGIYEVSAGLNLFLYKGFFIGATAKNGLLKITENKIADYNASMSINNVGGKIGGDWYVGEKNNAIFSLAITAGSNWTKYSDIKYIPGTRPPVVTKFKTNYFEPEMDIYFLIEQNFAIGATLSYTVFDAHFNPYDLDLNQYSQFSSNNAVSTQFLSFGFGFYYSLFHKKR